MAGASQDPVSTGLPSGNPDDLTQESGVSEDPRLARFRTGQVFRSRLLQALVEKAGAGAGAVLPAGTPMGPWRLIRLIASGGMSHVYLAERADGQFEQTVALKVVRHNADLLARLRHERQIIATLRHPHIVSLVDGGETDSGDLWFAMALVEGSPIDQYVTERKLDWRRRLALFDQVCAAIEYAHSRALIHRDLKPSNILVDQHGHPRLLDFGIALEAELTDGAEDHVHTPGFASPEQKAGSVITTASDVFQLGLILRAMFSPHEDDHAPAVSMPRRVASDLQRLIDRACSADPVQRHGSAAALRDDVGAILDGHVLAADRQDPWRRAARYVTRHRAAIAVAAIGSLSLLVVLVMAAWQLRQERNQAIENARRAEAVSTFLVDTLGEANPYSGRRGEASILDAMDLAAATLDERLADAPAVRRQLRSTIASVYMNLDEPQRCLDVTGSGTADADLGGADPQERALALILRSECYLARDDRDPAWALLEQAEAELAPLAASQELDRLRAWVLIDMGQLLSLNGRLAEANVLLEQALALAQSSGDGEQVYRAYRFLAGNAQGVNQSDRAEAWLGQAHAAATESLGPGHRSTLTVAGQWAVALGRLKRFAEAELLLEQSLEAARAVKHRDGGAEVVIAQLLDNHATLLWEQGRFKPCIEQARAAVEIYQRLAASGSTQAFNPSWRSAACAYQDNNWDLAETYARDALAFAEHGVPVGKVNGWRMLAAVAAQRGQLDESRAFLDRAQALAGKTEIANQSVFVALHLTEALWAVKAGREAAAENAFAEADSMIKSLGITAPWVLQEQAVVAKLLDPAT